jgi:ubiquinone/menaquinone biosynthesis C-methylase UbiE
MAEDTNVPTEQEADSLRFDDVAALYDTYRPSYPTELIDDIVLLSGIQQEGRILEIGSGTGKATILFAQRGYTILCLEPGQNLIAVATKNLVSYPRVSFIRARFEEWASDQEKFDLVISAQAFHWVPEEVRYVKTASLLKHQGHLATFWNMYPGMDGKIRQELDQVYRARAPELVKAETPVDDLIASRERSIRESRYYENVVIRKYPWSMRYSTNEYLGLLNTYSDHLRLSEQRRRGLLGEIADVIERNSGSIERPYLAVVYVARRNSCT